MSLDLDLATLSFNLQQLEKIPLFQRGSKDNEDIWKIRAEIANILKEYSK